MIVSLSLIDKIHTAMINIKIKRDLQFKSIKYILTEFLPWEGDLIGLVRKEIIIK